MPFDDGAPAIDGLFIFPEPQEVDRGDGFVEFRVTAYGRTGFPAEYTKSYIENNYFYTRTVYQDGNPISAPIILNPRSLNESYVQRLVYPSDASLEEISSNPPQVENPAITTLGNEPRILRTEIFVPSDIFDSDISFIDRTVTYTIRFLAFSSTNYGKWSENVISWYASAFVNDKALR